MNHKKEIPDFVKQPVKFLISSEERKRMLEQNRIRKEQDKAIRQLDASAKKLLIFLVPGLDRATFSEKISGGVMSIVSFCEESAGMKDVHGAEVILCTLPYELLFLKHTQFANQTSVFRFSQIREYFTKVEELILHLPEFACGYFLEYLDNRDRKWMKQLKKNHINILNQNIRLMPYVETISALKQLATVVTMTTAHQRYSSQHFRDLYMIPVHKLSVWISPEKYEFRPYNKKENLLIVSPDENYFRQEMLTKLEKIPGLKVQIIQNLTYEQYKNTIVRAKWALTFGEGLDGYIIEPIFSGAIGFAVYDENFFTEDFKNFPTIYPSYQEMLSLIARDIGAMDHEEIYKTEQQKQFDLCAKYYSYDQYRKNILDFYSGAYTFK
jgi:hypothetical protein